MSLDLSRIPASRPPTVGDRRRSSTLHEQFGFACGISAIPAMAAAHRHDDVELTVALGGRAVMEHGGRRHPIADGSCLIFWAGVPHRLVETDSGVSVRWLTVPLVEVLAWSLTEDLSADLLGGAVVVPMAPPLLKDLMETWAAEIGTEPALTEAARLEVKALFVRIGRRGQPLRASRGGSPAPNADRHAAAIAAYIATHFHEPLQIADIAGAVHLHPSTAGAVFRAGTGVTIGRYLTQCRVAEAQRLLIATDATTTDIAIQAGFGSTSSFYSAFLQTCQVAPAAYRRAMIGHAPPTVT